MENFNLPTSFIEDDIIESVERGQAIVTRFPPEPNGYMHIGHAKAFGLDYFLAKKYGGHTFLRFEDTNPAKESMEFVENMKRDIRWLGMDWKQVVFASDYYEWFYDDAVSLIKKGLAYVDDSTPEQMSTMRGSLTTPGVESPFRNRSVDENLELFADMRDGKFADGACVLRAKIDMKSPNMNMRDPAIYRILREVHYRTGDKWCIYPMYDFVEPLCDIIEGISHSICSFEYIDHRPLYEWFLEHSSLKPDPQLVPAKRSGQASRLPRQFEFSRLNIDRFVMSKRWLKKFVDEGLVDGWDDPRMPTISGLRRRGYPAKAVMDFVMSTGVSKAPMCVPVAQLEHFVRTNLDPVVTRVAAVCNPILVRIKTPASHIEEFEVFNNPHNEADGKHKIAFGREIYIDGEDFSSAPPPKWKRLSSGGAVRLRGAYIIRCDNVVYKKDGTIDYLECVTIEDGNIKPSGVIQFVEKTTAVAAVVNEFQPLLKQGIELSEENINPTTKIQHNVLCENFVANAKAGEVFQFVRKGFFCVDSTSVAGNLVFNKTVGLKEGF